MTWKLQAITGELEGQEVTVDRDMLVGRHQDADLQLQAAEISRRHAAFLLKDKALWVQDLKSSNGTFVNDIRIDQDKLLMDGDIVQFASIKFSVLAPAKPVENIVGTEVPEIEVEPVSTPVEQSIQQPSEAIATAEVQQAPVEKTPAQQMNEQGMPELSARDANVQVSKDGMPTGMGVPKPAPIPANVDIHATPIPEACDIKTSDECAKEEVTTQKNAMLGLYTIIALVILAIIAWLFFK
ncbi:FHA domain-containing protein [Acinetobacter wuhouensis]|jgi:pSer/pThr/pTyr-binding forkhead associated (FHA) protein/predicted nucleic acid-binding Zn ribbon protein|uniref:FHA domain-containing protein n=1 Tax=Acinetobacter wuhouensis TaxID=1879050 RepID=A0A4Q7ALG2_9GAMM|nr:FHA domain-containing protein [Acinetobacter wuhouensis]RZG48323.1 FHA domain-containing protein [Acinetobacter wuhouensis]RZG74513.1 FHA domain-containing protein [Acinetobacter wuhouensis]